MDAVDQIETLFGPGPFPHFQRSLGLLRPVGRNIIPRVFTSVLIGWLPLVVLVAVAGHDRWNSLLSFAGDLGTHARSLIAAPLFILCEVACLKRLAAIVHQFPRSGVIRPGDQAAFNALVTSNRSLINAAIPELVAIIAAYAIAISLIRYLPHLPVRPWIFNGGDTVALSLAGWWYSLVSLPLLLILLFGWLWRVVLWSRFLLRIAAMKLRLIAAHPDRASGLKFLNSSLVAFTPLGFTFGVIAAGAEANQVASKNASMDDLQATVFGLIVFVLLLFVGPLLVFIFKLHAQKVEGIFTYGSLADRVGHQFEEKWLRNYDEHGGESLESPDFSATTDLYSVVANVHNMKLFPFELRAVVSLVAITLLPFIPVVAMMMPIKLIVKEVARLLI